MAVRVVEFSSGGTKLERFLPINQHTQRKGLNFENWFSGELSRIGPYFSNKVTQKLMLFNNKKLAHKRKKSRKMGQFRGKISLTIGWTISEIIFETILVKYL